MTPEYTAFASQKIRLVEELLIQNESRGLLEIGPAMLPVSIVVVPIGVPGFLTEYCSSSWAEYCATQLTHGNGNDVKPKLTGELTQIKCYQEGEVDEASNDTLIHICGYRSPGYEFICQTRGPGPHSNREATKP